jgi:hypothetical protein
VTQNKTLPIITLILGTGIALLGFYFNTCCFANDNFWDRTVRFLLSGIGAGIVASSLRLFLDSYHLTKVGSPISILLAGVILGGITGYGFSANVLQHYLPYAATSSTSGDSVIYTSLIFSAAALGIQGIAAKVLS